MQISVTERMTYKRCRRMWYYSSANGLNLTKVGSGAPALELGSLVHKALAQWMLEPKLSLETIFLHYTNDRIKEITEQYEQVVGAKISDDELTPIYDIVELGRAMMRNYQEYHKTPFPNDMTFAAAEQEVVVPIPETESFCKECRKRLSTDTSYQYSIDDRAVAYKDCKECKGTGYVPIYLTATLDGLLQDKKGWLYVLERKTVHPRYRPKTIDLHRADQFTGYAWVVSQLNIGPVAGIAYDGLIKSPKPAKGKTLEDLFIRTLIPKTPETLIEWERNLTSEALEMADCPPIYPNVPWQGCSDCAFIEPCTMQLLGEDPSSVLQSQFTQRIVTRVQGIVDYEQE